MRMGLQGYALHSRDSLLLHAGRNLPVADVQGVRSERPQTINERLLGSGMVYSCTDYGDHKQMTDDELIAKVKQTTSVQATKISDKDDNVAEHIGIFTNQYGYSVIPVFNK